jgi:prepilin-type N-terminal cleavage/methylation domain-containing protein
MFTGFQQKLNAIKKSEAGYTLIELILTIFIVGIILTTASVMLVALVRTSQRIDTRRNIRQDLELALEVMKRDVRNSDPSLSLIECDPVVEYQLSPNAAGQSSSANPSELDLVLTNSQATVRYSIEQDQNDSTYSLKRDFIKDGQTTTSYLTSSETSLQSFSIKCNKLVKENKFLLLKVDADSAQKDDNGQVVENISRTTGITIRNINTE